MKAAVVLSIALTLVGCQVSAPEDGVPSGVADTNPGSTPDTSPGSNPDTSPGRNPDTNPGRNPETSPGTNPDTNPGSTPDTTPGTNPSGGGVGDHAGAERTEAPSVELVAPAGELDPRCSVWEDWGELPAAGVRSIFSWSHAFSGICPATVPATAAEVRFWLPPEIPEAAARAALRYTGTGSPEVLSYERLPDQVLMTVRLPAGIPGQENELVLAGPTGPAGTAAEVGLRLERRSVPQVEGEWRQGQGPWQPLVAGQSLPRQPVTLRFTGDRTLLALLRREAESRGFAVGQSDGAVVIDLPEPPPRLRFSLAAPYAGLPPGREYVLYFGPEPELVAVDLGGGTEAPIATAPIAPVPADILTGALSANGRWAALVALAPESQWGTELWVVDLQTGRRQRTPFTYGPWPTAVAWWGDRLALPAAEEMQVWDPEAERGTVQLYPAHHWGAPSPDGRWLPGFSWGPGQAGAEPAPVTLVVYDLQRRTGQVLPDAVRRLVKPGHGPPRLPFHWTRDGRLLVEEQIAWRPEERRWESRWLELDLETGELEPHGGPQPESETPRIPPGASLATAAAGMPDGTRWVAGPGGWQARPGAWGPVTVREPGGSERTLEGLGEALVLGWSPEGQLLAVHWPNAAHRRLRAGGE